SARPYGPFVNRNDLACWIVMAVPLTMGYGAARIASRWKAATIDLEPVLDTTTVALVCSLCLMLGVLLVTQSRSGMTAAAAGILGFVLMSHARSDRRRTTWLVIAEAALAVI